MLIFVVGATGFIGGHLVRALRNKGHSVKCLARKPERAALCSELGVEAVIGDINDPPSLEGALDGVHALVNLAGIIEEKGPQTFRKIHVEGPRNLAVEARRAGIKRFFHQSALGTDPSSKAVYQRTKAEGEEAVRESGVPFTIFRPSLVVGAGDGFTSKIMDIIKSPAPFIPVPGRGEALFQPLFVGDWVECCIRALETPEAAGRIYELGGPEHLSYNRMVKEIAEAMGVNKRLLHVPMGISVFGAMLLQKTPFRPVTPEQLMLLEKDNIAEPDVVRKEFGFAPLPFREALRRFISPPSPGR